MFVPTVTLGDIATSLTFVISIVVMYVKLADRVSKLEAGLDTWKDGHKELHVEERRICDVRHPRTRLQGGD